MSAVATLIEGRAGNDTIIDSDGDDAVHGGDGNDSISYTGSGNIVVRGGSGDDKITVENARIADVDGGAGDDVIIDNGSSAATNLLRGGDGNDQITFASASTVEGGSGNDTLTESGNYINQASTLIGGTGNDRMTGALSSNTYIFNRGDGSDSILDVGIASGRHYGTDKLVFGSGIVQTDLAMSRSGEDLVIKVNNLTDAAATDQIVVEKWFFSDGGYQIESFAFADGSSLTNAEVTQLGNAIYGTDGADTLTGAIDNNTIYGLAGNDSITDPGGADTIDGGAGDDVIIDNGGSAATNLLRGGDGNDQITFASASTVEGGSGNDTLTESGNYINQASTLIGGTGNDRMTGALSSNTYIFNRGDGSDSILDVGIASGRHYGTDKLVFGSGIVQTDLAMSRSGDDLVIKVNNLTDAAATDQIVVEKWFFSDGGYQIESFAFADGSSLTATQLIGTSGSALTLII
ncbi:hypothetical protein H7U20_19125 [Rugamonas sp. CCM 8940]|uniref:calcium-binding protein n=1 Tax=Rugamonas sp. CCM 8940 TaxID=2765359 RepID=UPI0018F66195|nr:calcium-binding protein [Rugamonas sp. CCM 8940]MBJ7312297.1 hypothetical protein [Rugamonas sp. CCM 8940]